MRTCAALAALAAVIVGYLRLAPQRWQGAGGMSLLGEAHIRGGGDARRFATAMHREARQIWQSPSTDWNTASVGPVRVESIRIDLGPFNRSGVLLTRAVTSLANASAGELYALLTSPEGFAIIDPMSDPADFSEYLRKYRWGGRRLELAEAKVEAVPGLSRAREFCVLNAFDCRARTFVSKSVQHNAMPGSSPYADGGDPPAGRVRALNTFALRTTPLPGGMARLELINYADLVGAPTLMNWINVKAFLPGLVDRLRARLARGQSR